MDMCILWAYVCVSSLGSVLLYSIIVRVLRYQPSGWIKLDTFITSAMKAIKSLRKNTLLTLGELQENVLPAHTMLSPSHVAFLVQTRTCC